MIFTAFTESNVEFHELHRLKNAASDERDFPRRNEPEWMKQGLQQTSTGYGRKLNTGRMVHFCGRWRRLYAICYSNAASTYFLSRGRMIFV